MITTLFEYKKVNYYKFINNIVYKKYSPFINYMRIDNVISQNQNVINRHI